MSDTDELCFTCGESGARQRREVPDHVDADYSVLCDVCAGNFRRCFPHLTHDWKDETK